MIAFGFSFKFLTLNLFASKNSPGSSLLNSTYAGRKTSNRSALDVRGAWQGPRGILQGIKGIGGRNKARKIGFEFHSALQSLEISLDAYLDALEVYLLFRASDPSEQDFSRGEMPKADKTASKIAERRKSLGFMIQVRLNCDGSPCECVRHSLFELFGIASRPS